MFGDSPHPKLAMLAQLLAQQPQGNAPIIDRPNVPFSLPRGSGPGTDDALTTPMSAEAMTQALAARRAQNPMANMDIALRRDGSAGYPTGSPTPQAPPMEDPGFLASLMARWAPVFGGGAAQAKGRQ